jgi:hypothetical protein
MTEKSGNSAAHFLLNHIPVGVAAKEYFATYRISERDEQSLRDAAKEDARKYVYNGIVSFLGGIASIHSQHAVWAVTKMYYAAFYIGRAAICRSGIVIFHVPKSNGNGNTQYQVRIFPGMSASIVDKPPSTHKLVAKLFRDDVGYPSFMRGLKIDEIDPILWLMEQREYWQYRAGRFPDPDMPDLFDQIGRRKMSQVLAAYAEDSSGIYLADRSHALVSVPFRLLVWALSQEPILSPGVVDPEDVMYLRKQCRVGGQKLSILERYLLADYS